MAILKCCRLFLTPWLRYNLWLHMIYELVFECFRREPLGLGDMIRGENIDLYLTDLLDIVEGTFKILFVVNYTTITIYVYINLEIVL